MYDLKQSTAITIPVFAHDASGDAVTGMIDGGFTKRISKNGAAFGAMTVTITEMENGWYSVPISTSHSDTTGVVSVTLTNGSCKQINIQFRIQARLVDNVPVATDIVTSGAITTSGGAVSTVTTLNGHTAQTGDTYALANGSAGFVAIDTVVDLILVDTDTTIPALIATAQADLDIITGVSGVNLLTATQTSIDAIETDTGTTIPTLIGTPVTDLAADIAVVDGIVDDILLDTAEIGTAGAGLGDLGGMSTAMKAEVLVEVNAALDTAISELGVAAPATTPTLRSGLMLLYMMAKNQTIVQTSGTDAIEFYNAAGTKITQKLLTDDGDDLTEGKMG